MNKSPKSLRLVRALLAAGMLAPMAGGAALAAGDPVEGIWKTENGRAHVQIKPCGTSMCGNIIWMAEPNKEDGTPKRDRNNPDEAKQEQPILGLQIISGFERDKPGVWDDGDIYDPESGKTYGSNLEVKPDGSLGVEGCILFLCQEQTWTRVE